MRVDDGIEGLVHISELAERHVELPEQVVTVGDDIFVKVIDIDLERRRISLSLKQANDESAPVAEFDPTLYGMAAEYDEQGNYKYPEGFDPETNEWLDGLRGAAREVGEAVRRGARPLGGAQGAGRGRPPRPTPRLRPAAEMPTSYSSSGSAPAPRRRPTTSAAPVRRPAPEGTLASDEALAALREKLTGG